MRFITEIAIHLYDEQLELPEARLVSNEIKQVRRTYSVKYESASRATRQADVVDSHVQVERAETRFIRMTNGSTM